MEAVIGSPIRRAKAGPQLAGCVIAHQDKTEQVRDEWLQCKAKLFLGNWGSESLVSLDFALTLSQQLPSTTDAAGAFPLKPRTAGSSALGTRPQ